MAESYRFFDLHGYTESEFAEVEARKRRDGVLVDVGNRLAVTIAGSVANVDTGEAFVQGFWYKNTTSKSLAITANASATARVDLVVLKLDRDANTLTAQIHQGVLGGGAPAPTQVAGLVWELVLATVSTASGVSTVTDARTYSQTVVDSREILATQDAALGVTMPRMLLTADMSTRGLYYAEPAPSAENGLLNSSFRMNQRATAFGALVAGAKAADLWAYQTSGSLSNAGLTAGGIIPGTSIYVPWSLIVQRSNSNALGTTSYDGWTQALEGNQWGRLHGAPLVWSSMHYATKATNVAIGIRNYAGNRAFYHVFPLLATTWTFCWFRIPPDLVGTWVTNGTAGAAYISVFPTVSHTSLLGGTPDTWSAGNFVAPVGFVNTLTATNDALYTTAPKLEIGYYPTRFMLPDIQIEEQQAHRVFRRFFYDHNVPVSVDAFANGWITEYYPLAPDMRAAPTLSNSVVTIYASRNPSGAETGWTLYQNALQPTYWEPTWLKASAGGGSRWWSISGDLSAELI